MDFRSDLSKNIPQWSPAFYKYLDIYKKAKPLPNNEECKKLCEDAKKEHDYLVKRIKLHDQHMMARVNKFAKSHSIIPDQNFDEIREDIQKHKLSDRMSFYAKGDNWKEVLKYENRVLIEKMKEILKDVQFYQKYNNKVKQINIILSKGTDILKKAQEVLEKMGPERALNYIKNQLFL